MRRKCYAHRTAVFAAVSEWNKPEKTMWSTSAFREALNKLTVEYITNEVGLLGIRCLLWPALRPFSECFVRYGMFGLTFQSKKKGILLMSREG